MHNIFQKLWWTSNSFCQLLYKMLEKPTTVHKGTLLFSGYSAISPPFSAPQIKHPPPSSLILLVRPQAHVLNFVKTFLWWCDDNHASSTLLSPIIINPQIEHIIHKKRGESPQYGSEVFQVTRPSFWHILHRLSKSREGTAFYFEEPAVYTFHFRVQCSY